MKKALVILVLVMAAPLYATTVTFTPSDPCDGTCVIDWTSDVPIVAMGIDVDVLVGDPCAISAVALGGGSNFFDIYMDAAYDEEAGDGYSYGEGTPIADKGAPGEIALPKSNFCISMGGLGGETGPLNDPCTSGTITLTAAASCSGTLNENSLRGGVIDENGDTATTNLSDLPFTITVDSGDCMTNGGVATDDPLYLEWAAVGKPECWCYDTQCMGDADTAKAGSKWTGYYYVGTGDVTVLAAAWMVKEPTFGPGITSVVSGVTPGACADFDRAKAGSKWTGYYRVGTGDVTILAANWMVKQPTFGPGIARTCVPGYYITP